MLVGNKWTYYFKINTSVGLQYHKDGTYGMSSIFCVVLPLSLCTWYSGWTCGYLSDSFSKRGSCYVDMRNVYIRWQWSTKMFIWDHAYFSSHHAQLWFSLQPLKAHTQHGLPFKWAYLSLRVTTGPSSCGGSSHGTRTTSRLFLSKSAKRSRKLQGLM